jgi:hypothetical protein
MNKRGKTSPMLIAGGILALIILAVIAWGTVQTQIGTTQPPIATDPTMCPESTGVLTINAMNALQRGTSVTVNTTAGVAGGPVSTAVTSGTTTFPVGSKVVVLASAANYLDRSFEFTMPCGGKILDVPMFAASATNPSLRIKNDDDNFMTDAIAGGAVNQTAVSAGETLAIKVEFKGVNLENTGDLIYIIELPAGTSANVTDILMPGATRVNLPSVHTTINAGSKVQAFRIPAIEGAVTKTYAVSIVLGSGKIIAGGVYTDWYAEQEFVDIDGSVKTGVEDSNGNAKYENTGDFDFYINAA